ncbi:hypothetical protein SKAU_G00066190 [Synaphobranchus kaupii]|uniref:Uncharacterized protein n=1 Tax=Synaphobranchus kaupii TaxID=118154 RepID=A0A9Q1G5T4_SYNKA|nr:hypothetical protein SKAU_G00066190 [Synaphobranchus kaupii]
MRTHPMSQSTHRTAPPHPVSTPRSVDMPSAVSPCDSSCPYPEPVPGSRGGALAGPPRHPCGEGEGAGMSVAVRQNGSRGTASVGFPSEIAPVDGLRRSAWCAAFTLRPPPEAPMLRVYLVIHSDQQDSRHLVNDRKKVPMTLGPNKMQLHFCCG